MCDELLLYIIPLTLKKTCFKFDDLEADEEGD